MQNITSEAPVILSDAQIQELNLPLDMCFEAVKAAFAEHACRAIEMPPKVGVHPAERSFIHAMPAYLPRLEACGMKWVSGYPANSARGLPMISGQVLLNDPSTGLLNAILDARWITAMRTAVVSALLLHACAKPDVVTLGLAGCGVQGRYHLRCICHLFSNLSKISLFDLYREKAEELRREAVAYTDAEIVIADSPEACLAEKELCATCTSGNALQVKEDWLAPGATAVGVDSHVAWVDLFGCFEKFIVDDVDQCRTFERQGKYRGDLPPIHAELSAVLAGQAKGRDHAQERILGLPLGLAIADIVLAQAVIRRFRA